MATEEEDHAAFDDEEDDIEDTEGDDSDMEEEFDDDESAAATVTVTDGAYPDSSVPSTSTNPSPDIPNPPPTQNGTVSVPIQSLPAIAAPDPKRQRTEEMNPPPVTPPPIPLAAVAPPSTASLEDSRRLFQRLWTDDDEIKILKGFLEFTSSRGTTFASHQYDTGPFYEQIKNQLQLDFNKNQLIEKLRRLKKKYRNTASRMANHGREFAFKSPHEKATYEIARKIWSASIKRSQNNSDDDDLNPYANSNSDATAAVAAASADRQIARSRRRGRKRALDTIPVAPPPIQVLPALPALMPPPPPPAAAVVVPTGISEGVVKVEVQTAPAPVINQIPVASPAPPPAIPSIVEETVKSCLSPIFKELLNSAVSGPIGSGLGFGLMGSGLAPVLSFGGKSVDLSNDRWKQQQILELEVYLKRVELVRDQIKSTLEELKLPAPAAES